MSEPGNKYEPSFENRIDLTELKDTMHAVKQEVKKVIIGQDEVIHKLLISILAAGHSLIEGMPGVAKNADGKINRQSS